MLVNSNDDIKTIVALSAGVISSILYHVSIYTLFVKTAQGWGWHSLWRSLVLQKALNTPRWQLAEFAPLGNGKMKLEVPLFPWFPYEYSHGDSALLSLRLVGLLFEWNKRKSIFWKGSTHGGFYTWDIIYFHLTDPQIIFTRRKAGWVIAKTHTHVNT